MAKVRKQDYEKLDDATVSHVIELLANEKPITKKDACKILNISYNTARLNRIMEEYKTRKAFEKEQYRRNKGKAITDYETQEIVLNYLRGDSKTEIGKSLFRPVYAVSAVLRQHNIPVRQTGKGSYHNPVMIPDEAVAEVFEPGELAWSARYNCVCEIRNLRQVHEEHGNVYTIWVFGSHNEFANQPWSELGKLNFLKDSDINFEAIQITDKLNLEYR